MYNKYFTMKRSELKEAIKNEITSVLLEGMSDEERENRIQHLMRTGAKEKPLRKLAAIGKKEDEEDQSQSSSLIGRMGDRSLEEVYQTNSKISQIVSLFQDMMADEYDGMDYRKALNDVLKAIDDDYKAAERFGEKISNIREEDEAPAGDKETEKSARGKDKITIDFRNVMKKYNELKEKDKKEAVEYLKSNQDIVKKYKKAKEIKV